jgi:chromate transporter
MTGAFILTGGNATSRLAYMLFGLELPVSIFSIDMLVLMLITIFVICFVGASKSKLKLLIALVMAVLFALSNGRAAILEQFTLPLAAIMAVMAAASIVYDISKNKKKKQGFEAVATQPVKFDFKPLRNLLFFLTISLLLVLLTFLSTSDTNVWDFAFRVITSSLSSFGGGEVYIGISEAVFVQTGFIPEEIYSTQIIGIANTMPGPVIVAIVAGIGYTYGTIHHGIFFGWMFGLLGLSLTVSATAIGALTLLTCFGFLKNSKRLHILIKYIMPVVCGILVSTALSLLRQASSVLINASLDPLLSISIVLSISVFMLFLHYKYNLNDLVLLLLGAVGTITGLGVLGLFSA